MAKNGNKSMKRIATPKAVPIHDKKSKTWITKPEPGAHNKKHSVALEVMLKDIIKVCKSRSEVKAILTNRLVTVDGRTRIRYKKSVGFMDVLGMEKAGKTYRVLIDRKGRLIPVEIKKDEASKKLAKVTRKHRSQNGKINLTLHDGRNISGDNNIKVGDSLVISLPDGKLQKHLKLENGAQCLIQEGKHAGMTVTLEEIIPRAAGKPAEAKVKTKDQEFITVARYLFVVDKEYKGVVQ